MLIKGETTLTSKGQITVPKPIQERLGLRIGDPLVVEVEDADTIRFKRLHPAHRTRKGSAP